MVTPWRSQGQGKLEQDNRTQQDGDYDRTCLYHNTSRVTDSIVTGPTVPWTWDSHILPTTKRLFNLLNVRSDDRTTAARIRDAAISEFAANGVAGTSVRTIATAAHVSPGLVIHHFGSKENLRVACDEHVAGLLRELKSEAMASGAGIDPMEALRRQSSGPPAAKYLARTLVDGSPHVAELVDELVADAVVYMQTGVESGMITPTKFPQERAAILSIWALGAFVLHEHLERLIGVDITADLSADPKAAAAYIGPALEIAAGYITQTTKELMTNAFVGASPEEEQQEKEQA